MFMSIFSIIEKEPRTLNGMVKYAKRSEKDEHILLDGLGLNHQYAAEEMFLGKQLCHKLSKRQYKQFIFSFDENVNLSYETIAEIGYKIGAYYANDYQILMTIHFDTNNTHIHYVLNTINVNTGQKFRSSRSDLYNYKLYINKILQEYELSPIQQYRIDISSDLDDINGYDLA